ncbi:alcohol dehydrogenase catalytic domain-containing protein [Gorillibacterium sp. sgz5001074]|uniref:alcohol dehydrogenase catalytic domain-containing protein n=1 Tax=Gorillibacterium sp. sgz5001074 TaxID=3446695 RepID=UPI003F66EFF8
MRAAVYTGFRQIKYAEVPDVKIQHPEDMIVRVTATTICGSDLHFYHGLVNSLAEGSIIGHEAVGEVVETGPDVVKVRKGDKVVLPFNVACGHCRPCLNGLESQCDTANEKGQAGAYFGCSRLYGDYEGCQAEYVRVPFANFTSFAVPKDNELDDRKLLLLSDTLPTSYWAIHHSGVKPGDTVIVIGCGPIGLMVQKCAWLQGASRVIAVDLVPERLEYARRVNKAEVYNLTEYADLAGDLYENTGGGADVVLDCVGGDGLMTPGELAQTFFQVQGGGLSAFQMAQQTVAKGGTIQLVGIYALRYNQFPLGDLFARNVVLKMGQAPVIRYMEPLYQLLKSGRLDTDIYSHTLPLSEASEAYRLFDHRADGCLKVLLQP